MKKKIKEKDQCQLLKIILAVNSLIVKKNLVKRCFNNNNKIKHFIILRCSVHFHFESRLGLPCLVWGWKRSEISWQAQWRSTWRDKSVEEEESNMILWVFIWAAKHANQIPMFSSIFMYQGKNNYGKLKIMGYLLPPYLTRLYWIPWYLLCFDVS